MEFSDLGIRTKPGQKRYATICPQCNNTRTKHKGALCLTVNDEPGNRWFNCNHCDWSGNLEVMDKFKEVQKASNMPTQQRAFTMKAMEYLKKRGISLNTAKKLKLYETMQHGNTIIGWPFFMGLTLVNVKFLNIDYKPKTKSIKWFQLPQDLGTRIIPFGMQLLKTHDSEGNKLKKTIVLLSEGEIDMATWVECGYENSISVPQGAPSLNSKNFTKEFAYLSDPYVKSVFEEVDLFYLSVDADEPGKNLAKHLGTILGKDKCRIVKYPVGYKDINEVFAGNENKGLKALGKEGVDECFNNVVTFPINGVIKASHLIDELKAYREQGFLPGLNIGVPEIDRLFTVKRKLLMILVGLPGSGKSVWIRWYIVKLIQNNADLDIKFALFTPENRPVAREYAKIAESLTGQTIKKGEHNSMSDEMYRKAMIFVEKHFFIIAPDKTNFEKFNNNKLNEERVNTLDSILSYVSYLKKTENIFGYVIDAWNKIEHEQPKYMTETQFAGQQLDKILNFNDYYDVFGALIVHPTKTDMIGENFKMPTLYSAKGSSAFKEKADIGIIAHRNKMKKKKNEDLTGDETEDEKWITVRNAPTIIKTEKIKFEELGVEDKIKMEMKYGRFLPIDEKQRKKQEKEKEDNVKQREIFTPDIEDEDDIPF